MLNRLSGHFEILFLYIPNWVLWLLLIVLIFGVVKVFCKRGLRDSLRQISLLILCDYVVLLFLSTVFFRRERPERTVYFTPFWSYKAISEGQTELLAENILNVIAFIPIGLLIKIGSPIWTWKKVFVMGCLISLCVEIFQYILNKGFCEIDDVIHNAIGCLIGIGLACLIIKSKRLMKI